VEQEEAATARQWHGKPLSALTDTNATLEDTVFSVSPLIGNGSINTFPQQ
jgi:hypothetical protein